MRQRFTLTDGIAHFLLPRDSIPQRQLFYRSNLAIPYRLANDLFIPWHIIDRKVSRNRQNPDPARFKAAIFSMDKPDLPHSW